MDEMFTELEQKIRSLLVQQAEIKESNIDLTCQQSVLTKDKKSLLVKQQQIISHIQTLINKLKSIEMQL